MGFTDKDDNEDSADVVNGNTATIILRVIADLPRYKKKFTTLLCQCSNL
jgi:hypothetical protein